MLRLALVLATVAACSTPPATQATTPARTITSPPYAGSKKLVVLLVIDQLPQWAFIEKQAALPSGGVDRLLRDGTWHLGSYPTPATLTGPGHAMLGTGEVPARTGIAANEWFDRSVNGMVTSIDDGTGVKSAARLRVRGIGDAVVAANTGAKAVSVSLKDRSAILPLGHQGLAVWYDKKQAGFISNQPVPWLAAHNAAHPVQPRLASAWTPVDAARLAQLSGTVDAQVGEIGEKGFGPTFPHAPTSTPDAADAVFAMPLGNELVFEAARAAITGEQLGTDATPDLLIVSLSAHDYIAHGWGHESWETWDAWLRLDADIAAFLRQLDEQIGAGAWAMVVTSDHGAGPLPERMHGGRMTPEDTAQLANNAAATELGRGAWIASAKYPFVFFTPALLAKPSKERSKAIHKVLLALRAQPGIAVADRVASFVGDCERRSGDARAICLMLDRERAGDLFYLPAAGWTSHDADEPTATAHGSWNAYDREVPVILLPFGRTPHARQAAADGTLDMREIAPLLATWLGVAAPSTLR